MREVMGIINDTIVGENLRDLISHRSIAAIPFGGRYRLIDFPLSSMVNSGIRNIGIVTQRKNRSLLEHLESGADWDLNSKKDGLFILPPVFEKESYYKNLGDVDYYHKHLDYLKFSTQKYVLLANSNVIYNMDFNGLWDFFKHKKADIAFVYQQMEDKFQAHNHTMFEMDNDRVTDIAVNPQKKINNNLSLGIMLIKKEILIELIDHCISRGLDDLVKDGIIPKINQLKMMAYSYKGFWGKIHSTCSYYKYSKKLLESQTWKNLFISPHPILTRVQNEPPAKYCAGSKVVNSLIANGCIIEGSVVNSILFRGVKVEKGAVVKDSIVMQKGVIGLGATLENAILDKDIVLNENTKIISPKQYPTVIERRTRM